MTEKEESEKAGLKWNIQKTKIMASSLTTWSQIGEKWNQVYVPTTDAKEAEVDWFYEDVQHLLELTPKKTKNNKFPFPHRGLEYKSRKSRDTWNNRQVWPWSSK